MPVLQLRIAPPPDAATRAELASMLTELTRQHLRKRAEVTAVLVDVYATGTWFIGGRAPQAPTALLEIDITEGTNTEAEKAAFVAAANDALRHRLATAAGFEAASYVVVRELPAGNWGYGGRTQRERQQARDATFASP